MLCILFMFTYDCSLSLSRFIGYILYATHMASKPHGKALPAEGFAEVKFVKYTRLTSGQLKCACNFTKQTPLLVGEP